VTCDGCGCVLFADGFSGVLLGEAGLITLSEGLLDGGFEDGLEVAGVWLSDVLCVLVLPVAAPATPPVDGDWVFCEPETLDCELGEATLLVALLCGAAWSVAEDTPGPTCADPLLQVSAMCLALVTVKFFEVEVDDCVWPVLLAEADEVVSVPVTAPISST
jgi:hypothetical protein